MKEENLDKSWWKIVGGEILIENFLWKIFGGKFCPNVGHTEGNSRQIHNLSLYSKSANDWIISRICWNRYIYALHSFVSALQWVNLSKNFQY